MIVTDGEEGVADGVYDVVQPKFDKVQDVGLNVPPALSLNNTVPVGVVGL